jgi:Flp pilus assembly protein TadG
MPSVSRAQHRPAAAAVEFAFVAPVLLMILVGVWETGRLIQFQQVLGNAAREGARLAAQGQTINSTGAPTQIDVDTGDPNVKTAILDYLRQDGFDFAPETVTVTFAYVSGDTTLTEPYQGVKGQQFKVTVTVPYDSFRWTTLGLAPPTQVTSSVTWASLVDDPFTLDTSMPGW